MRPASPFGNMPGPSDRLELIAEEERMASQVIAEWVHKLKRTDRAAYAAYMRARDEADANRTNLDPSEFLSLVDQNQLRAVEHLIRGYARRRVQQTICEARENAAEFIQNMTAREERERQREHVVGIKTILDQLRHKKRMEDALKNASVQLLESTQPKLTDLVLSPTDTTDVSLALTALLEASWSKVDEHMLWKPVKNTETLFINYSKTKTPAMRGAMLAIEAVLVLVVETCGLEGDAKKHHEILDQAFKNMRKLDPELVEEPHKTNRRHTVPKSGAGKTNAVVTKKKSGRKAKRESAASDDVQITNAVDAVGMNSRKRKAALSPEPAEPAEDSDYEPEQPSKRGKTGSKASRDVRAEGPGVPAPAPRHQPPANKKNPKLNDHKDSASEKLRWRIAQYLKARTGGLTSQECLDEDIFADGRRLYEKIIGTPSAREEAAHKNIIRGTVPSIGRIDEANYRVTVQQFWIIAAIGVEHAIRRKRRQEAQDWNALEIAKNQKKEDGLSMNVAMVQVCFGRDSTKMGNVYREWARMWAPVTKTDWRLIAKQPGKPPGVEPLWQNTTCTAFDEDYVALFPEEERKTLYKKIMAWEEKDPRCIEDQLGEWFFERDTPEQRQISQERIERTEAAPDALQPTEDQTSGTSVATQAQPKAQSSQETSSTLSAGEAQDALLGTTDQLDVEATSS